MNSQSRPNMRTPVSPRPNSLIPVNTLPETRRKRDSEGFNTTPADPGTLNLRESGASYVQSGHWEAVLTKVRGLREDMLADSQTLPGSQIFYGPNRHATREEILAAVPPRPVVDRLMALHFDSYILTPC